MLVYLVSYLINHVTFSLIRYLRSTHYSTHIALIFVRADAQVQALKSSIFDKFIGRFVRADVFGIDWPVGL